MRLNAYLGFDGTCREAMEFYRSTLGGEMVMMMTYGDAPPHPDMQGNEERIMHARLVVGDAVLMASDAPAGHYDAPRGIEVALNVDEPAEAERIYSAFSEGGTVRMPIQETFWARRFAMLTDRFGTPWLINCEKPMQ
jgi:PhnB protein